jgi:hypothetical protein
MIGPAQPAMCQVDTCPMTTNETIPFLLRLELDGGTSLEEMVSYDTDVDARRRHVPVSCHHLARSACIA